MILFLILAYAVVGIFCLPAFTRMSEVGKLLFALVFPIHCIVFSALTGEE